MAQTSTGDEHRPAKRTKYDYFETVIIFVGPEERKYVLPETIVCEESNFFQCACNGEWKEANEKTVKLPEVEPHLFGVFVGWLNTGELDFSVSAEGGPPPEYAKDMPGEAYDCAFVNIIDSFLLGDMLQSSRFCNALVDELQRFVRDCKAVPSPDTHPLLFDKLPQHSTMRRLMVDSVAFGLKKEVFLEIASSYPPDFILDVAKTSVANRDIQRKKKHPTARDKCYYHDHSDASKKCS